MARRRKRIVMLEEEPALDLSPLIDICFLLLIYFIVTSIIAPPETDLPLTLPASDSSEVLPEHKPFLITIDSLGRILINSGAAQEVLDYEPNNHKLPLLSQRLLNYASLLRTQGKEPSIQLKIANEAHHQRAVDVLNLLKKYNITQLTILEA